MELLISNLIVLRLEKVVTFFSVCWNLSYYHKVLVFSLMFCVAQLVSPEVTGPHLLMGVLWGQLAGLTHARETVWGGSLSVPPWTCISLGSFLFKAGLVWIGRIVLSSCQWTMHGGVSNFYQTFWNRFDPIWYRCITFKLLILSLLVLYIAFLTCYVPCVSCKLHMAQPFTFSVWWSPPFNCPKHYPHVTMEQLLKCAQ